MPDPRPPDSYGLDYTGAHCRADRHDQCPGYWAATPGRGTRCACPCHEPAALFPSADTPRRFTR